MCLCKKKRLAPVGAELHSLVRWETKAWVSRRGTSMSWTILRLGRNDRAGGFRVREWGHSNVGCHGRPAERLVSCVRARRLLAAREDSWESRSLVCSAGGGRKDTRRGTVSHMKKVIRPMSMESLGLRTAERHKLGRKVDLKKDFQKAAANRGRPFSSVSLMTGAYDTAKMNSKKFSTCSYFCKSQYRWDRVGGCAVRLLAFHHRRTRPNPQPGHSRIFASGKRAGRCRWPAGFLGELSPPPTPSLRSGGASHSRLISPSSALLLEFWLRLVCGKNGGGGGVGCPVVWGRERIGDDTCGGESYSGAAEGGEYFTPPPPLPPTVTHPFTPFLYVAAAFLLPAGGHGHLTTPKGEVDRSRWLRTTSLCVPTLNCFSTNMSSENGVFEKCLSSLSVYGTVAAERLACSPPTMANRVQSPAELTPGFWHVGIVPDNADDVYIVAPWLPTYARRIHCRLHETLEEVVRQVACLRCDCRNPGDALIGRLSRASEQPPGLQWLAANGLVSSV
ncbi:hypothetical protein PR048_004417 [Dryococelus australis]|uniref:Uncharacterized protein n=1 Tax=Dryococelus australis TaxID=614101 RepID=A0ABQ9I5U7_9NEOP|nr:hypothetical protein PR048_004417 [Dryococelus australis]